MHLRQWTLLTTKLIRQIEHALSEIILEGKLFSDRTAEYFSGSRFWETHPEAVRALCFIQESFTNLESLMNRLRHAKYTCDYFLKQVKNPNPFS
jgi:hypothetical protein